MTEDEFRKIVLEKFDNLEVRLGGLEKGQNNLEKGQSALEKGQNNLEKGQSALEKGQNNLEKGQSALEKGQKSILSELREFKEETSQNFEYTQKQIDQAFEKISDNMEYQDKVDTVVNILRNNAPTSKIFSKKRKTTA